MQLWILQFSKKKSTNNVSSQNYVQQYSLNSFINSGCNDLWAQSPTPHKSAEFVKHEAGQTSRTTETTRVRNHFSKSNSPTLGRYSVSMWVNCTAWWYRNFEKKAEWFLAKLFVVHLFHKWQCVLQLERNTKMPLNLHKVSHRYYVVLWYIYDVFQRS